MKLLLALCSLLALAAAQPAKNELWKGSSMDQMVDQTKIECAQKNDEVSCMKFKVLNLLDQIFRKDSFKASVSPSRLSRIDRKLGTESLFSSKIYHFRFTVIFYNHAGIRNRGGDSQLVSGRGGVRSWRGLLPGQRAHLLDLSRRDLQTADGLVGEGEREEHRRRPAHFRREVRPGPRRRGGPQVQAEEGGHPDSGVRPSQGDDADPAGDRRPRAEGLERSSTLLLQLHRLGRNGDLPAVQKDRGRQPRRIVDGARAVGVPGSVQILRRAAIVA